MHRFIHPKAIKETNAITNIGFYVTKRTKMYQMNDFLRNYKDYTDKEKQLLKIRSNMNKHRYAEVYHMGYSKYFLLNGKKMKVEQTNLDSLTGDLKPGKMKQIFSKSMKNRIISRTLLNKFIEEVA